MRLVPKRLAHRLILALTVLVAVLEAIFSTINVRVQERQLLDEMVTGVDQLSRGITSATWHAMLADNREDAYQAMQAVVRKDGVESIRIFNKEGRVTFSTDPHAATQVDKNAEACFLCHAREQPLVRVAAPNRARVYRAPDGHRKLAMVTPIYNEPACSQASCHAHPTTKSVLGVLDIGVDLGRVEHQIADLKMRALLVALLEVGLIGLFITFFTRRVVDRPIAKLIEGTQAISAMQLNRRIDVEGIGELEALATAFNGMADRLEVAMQELNALAAGLEHKVEERSRQLGAAQRKLIQSDRLASLGQLAASVAHEINNPISGVLNLSMLVQRLLRDDGIPPERIEDVRRWLAQISAETQRVGRIVADLLAFSRRPAPHRASADLNVLVLNTVTLVSHKLELAGVAPELRLDPHLPPVRCDSSQMQQVLINLVMNAAEAMGRGGRIVVRTSVETITDSVLLEVEDFGGGIPESNLSRIFDPFFTTKEEGKGVGLGLSVVYGIVDAHGGSIDVQSRVGAGTTFSVRLPLHPEPQRVSVETGAAPAAVATATAPANAAVLAPPAPATGSPASTPARDPATPEVAT